MNNIYILCRRSVILESFIAWRRVLYHFLPQNVNGPFTYRPEIKVMKIIRRKRFLSTASLASLQIGWTLLDLWYIQFNLPFWLVNFYIRMSLFARFAIGLALNNLQCSVFYNNLQNVETWRNSFNQTSCFSMLPGCSVIQFFFSHNWNDVAKRCGFSLYCLKQSHR